jgi:hypothetical protein
MRARNFISFLCLAVAAAAGLGAQTQGPGPKLVTTERRIPILC